MSAFVTSTFGLSVPSTTKSCPTWTCTTEPPQPSISSGDNLSSTDRQYIAKVRAKLFNARQKTRAAKSNLPDEDDSDTVAIADLPDNIDEIEDILYDRGPNNVNQVRLFGGWLDDSVAGRKARDPKVVPKVEEGGQFDIESSHKISLTKEEAVRQSNDIFAAAMEAFNKGRYRVAVGLYSEAVELVGKGSRLGGQYQLWHAQALDAAGNKKTAAKLLEDLKAHSDSDVRKVSSELLFIITAPKLELEPGTFLNIPEFDGDSGPERLSPVLSSSFGPLKTALLEKEPEPYSLEWYMKKERPPKASDNTGVELLLITAAIGVTMAYLLSTSPS